MRSGLDGERALWPAPDLFLRALSDMLALTGALPTACGDPAARRGARPEVHGRPSALRQFAPGPGCTGPRPSTSTCCGDDVWPPRF